MGQSRVDRDIYTPPDGKTDSIQEIIEYLKFNDKLPSASWGRKRDSKLVYDYYWGIRQGDLLLAELKKRYPKTYKTRRLGVENVTKAIVNHISVVYKQPPRRIVMLETTGNAERDKKAQADTQVLYEHIIQDACMNFQMQKLERYQMFDNTSLVGVWFDTEAQAVKMKVYPQFLFDVILDDRGNLSAVIVSDYFEATDIRNENKRTFTVWTPTGFWKLDDSYAIIDNGVNKDNVNPYGFIPFVLIRQYEPDTGVYCDPSLDLARMNLNVNFLLTDLMYLNEFQVHGQLVGKNVEIPKDMKGGPETIMMVSPKDPSVPYDLAYLQPNANFDALFSSLNRIITGFTATIGLPSQMFSVEKSGGTQSGVSLKIKNAPLIEFRKAMEEKFRLFENQITDVIVRLWNLNKAIHKLPELPESMNVRVIYEEAGREFETPEAEARTMATLVTLGLMKSTDAVIKMNPGFTQADAEEYLVKAQEEKAKIAQSTARLFGTQMPAEDDEPAGT